MPRLQKRNTKKTLKKKISPKNKSNNIVSTDSSDIKDLIKFVVRLGIDEVNIETEQLKLHVKCTPNQSLSYPPLTNISPPVETQKYPLLTQAEEDKNNPQKTSTIEIKSPMVGTFYRSPTPTDPPFISEGDRVKKGQVVCIVEAMKLFNEIESEISGKIVKIIAENSSPVECDQPLFLVVPD